MPQQFWPFRLHLAAKGSCFTQSLLLAGADLGRRMGWALLSALAWLIITPRVEYHGYTLCMTTGSSQRVTTGTGHPSNDQYGSFKVCSYIFTRTIEVCSHITVSLPITLTVSNVREILTAPNHVLHKPPFLLKAWNFAWQVSAVICPILAKDSIRETWSVVCFPKPVVLGCNFEHEIMGLLNSVAKIPPISKGAKLQPLEVCFLNNEGFITWNCYQNHQHKILFD